MDFQLDLGNSILSTFKVEDGGVKSLIQPNRPPDNQVISAKI